MELMLTSMVYRYSILFFLRSIFSVLRLAYWCGQFQVIDRAFEMLYFRLRGHSFDRGCGYAFANEYIDNGRYSVTAEDSRMLSIA